MDLWQQSIGSDGVPDGDPLAVTVGIEMRDATFSPDGAKLAYSRGRTVANLWRVPVLAARPATWSDAEQLTFDRASVGFADISRDGRTLLFDSDRSGNLELYKMSLMDGETVQLTTSPSPDGQPRLSPDGEEVVFYSYRSGNRDIWILPLNGDPARQLTDGRPTGSEFMGTAWSPDGTMVATGRSQANDTDIQVISIASGEVRAITTSPAEEDWWPIWSLDGKDLFFTNRRGLWAMPMSGGEPRFVSESAYAVTHWSKDGKRLFFGGRGDKSGDFWSLDLDDLSERRLTVLEGRRGRLSQNSLGSDGVHLYFSWREDFGDIWVMDVVTDESE